LTFRNYYVTCRPQFGAPETLRPGADDHLAPPCYATGAGAGAVFEI